MTSALVSPSLQRYRPEIDGLRAIAVLAVLLFHAEFKPFGGGYVGVDVFFVISGFLITGLIDEAARQGQFRFSSFYLRRARRLLPALFCTLLLTAAWASARMSSEHVKTFGQSLLYAAFALSNVFFWRESGYFDSDAALKPLLHTWSLAVEEQFYLVWPVFIFLLARRSRALLAAAIVGTSALSFAAALYTTSQDASTAFYATPLRVWEFGCGAMLVRSELRLSPLQRELLTATGLAMILASVFGYRADTTFPGLAALLPCVGTALTLLAGAAPRLGWLLRNRASVFVGKISYSLYLVHWPLCVFYKYYTYSSFTRAEKTVLVGVSLALAVVMWRYVEQPWRHPCPAPRHTAGRFALRCAGLSLALGAVGLILWKQGGLPRPIHPDNWRVTEYLQRQSDLNDTLTRRGTCYTAGDDHYQEATCLTLVPGKPNYLVVGDSYAAAAYTGMVEHFGDRAHLNLAAHTGCRPLLEATTARPGCAEQIEQIFYKHDLSAYDAVFLIGAFRNVRSARQLKAAAEQLERRGARRILVIGSPYGYTSSTLDTFRTFEAEPPEAVVRRLAGLVQPVFFDVDRRMAKLDLGPANYVSSLEVLCTARMRKNCIHTLPGTDFPLLMDATHLTPDAARWLFGQLPIAL